MCVCVCVCGGGHPNCDWGELKFGFHSKHIESKLDRDVTKVVFRGCRG